MGACLCFSSQHLQVLCQMLCFLRLLMCSSMSLSGSTGPLLSPDTSTQDPSFHLTHPHTQDPSCHLTHPHTQDPSFHLKDPPRTPPFPLNIHTGPLLSPD